MKRFFYGIKKQFFFYTASIILCLLLIISIIFAGTASQNIKELSLQSYSTASEQHLLNFQNNYNSLSNLTQSYVVNTYIQNALSSTDLSYQDKKYITSSLRYPNNDLVDFSVYVNNDSEIFYSSENARRFSLNTEVFDLFSSAVKDTYSRPVLLDLSEEYGDYAGLYMLRKIRHLEVNCPPGLLIIKIADSFYSSIFADNGFQKKSMFFLLGPDFSSCYVQNTTSSTLPSQETLEQFCTGFTLPYGYQHSNYFFSHQDPETGFWLLSVIPGSIIFAYSASFYRNIFLISILALLIFIPVIYLVSRHFTAPILELSETMNAFSLENMGKELHTHSNTEIDTISESYNKMVENIQELLAALEKKQEILRANEYSLLLHQINPHFLYNTLDNIHMLARMNGDSTTVQLISSLSKLLRISLSNGHEIISLSQELEHIRCYMDIEKIRTSGLFDYQIDVEPELCSVPIPKLILQPVVENCIKYGFGEMDDGGLILIQIRQVDESIWISIYNNGTPIADSALEHLNMLSALTPEEISQEFPQTSGGYGIANVICRLKLRYQNQFVLSYSACRGTLCTLVLPLRPGKVPS
ncbi:MAG: histidine kinase [Candidatus Limivivens sp.]|nr:histidine kinase [Candidatus Limivivens sp.]